MLGEHWDSIRTSVQREFTPYMTYVHSTVLSKFSRQRARDPRATRRGRSQPRNTHKHTPLSTHASIAPDFTAWLLPVGVQCSLLHPNTNEPGSNAIANCSNLLALSDLLVRSEAHQHTYHHPSSICMDACKNHGISQSYTKKITHDVQLNLTTRVP